MSYVIFGSDKCNGFPKCAGTVTVIINNGKVLHFEDICGIIVKTADLRACYKSKEKKQEEMAQKYRNGEITREEYDQWRYRYPRLEAERNETVLRALKESE